tara:strand:+ start:13466 stop:14179 length:714 start_codon:yes stop_codon:yes gene_type:complete
MDMISVCLASYNGQDFIERQVRSILAQIEANDELIISDDGSTDRTIEILENIHDDRIKLLHANSRNVIHNFQISIQHARGDYIFLADQDDLWLDGKVKKSMEKLKSGYCLALTDCKIVDENGEVLVDSYFKLRHSRPGFLNNFIRNSFMGCCMAFTKDVKDRALPFPANIPMHDLWIGLVAHTMGKVSFIHEPLLLYHRHDANISTTGLKSQASLKQKLRWRWQLAQALFSSLNRFF